MKGAVWGLIFLVTLISVSATYFPQPGVIFGFKGAECKNGTLSFNLTHEGNSVGFSSVNFTVESDDLGPQALQGTWYIDSDPVTNYEFPANNYTGDDFFGKSFYKFRSNSNFYAQGKYVVTLAWPSNSLYYDHIQFAAVCPGIKCQNNDQCISQQQCTNQTCQWVKCSQDKFATGHNCLPKCNDYNDCTNDYYVNGKCAYVKINNCVVKNPTIAGTKNIFVLIWEWLTSRY